MDTYNIDHEIHNDTSGCTAAVQAGEPLVGKRVNRWFESGSTAGLKAGEPLQNPMATESCSIEACTTSKHATRVRMMKCSFNFMKDLFH